MLLANGARADDYVPKRAYIYFIQPARPDMPDSPTPEESAAVAKHFAYLRDLTQRGIVALAGPATRKPYNGIVVYEAENDDVARQIAESDPAVRAGVFKMQWSTFVPALVRDRIRSEPLRSDRTVRHEVDVNASVERVWHAWSTPEGLRTFFSPNVNMSLAVGGPFELLFAPPEAPKGTRGSEGMHVLAWIPREMLAFEWNAPPKFAELRDQRTHVVVQMRAIDATHTHVTLTHVNFGTGPGWDAVAAYFDDAWSSVLAALKKSFD